MPSSHSVSNMPNRLVIVESPAKCSKIQSFLGDGWRVMASMGHIRGLQEKLDAVGINTGWTPIYEEHSNKKEQIAKLRKAAKEADEVWLSTDPDREGEGIAWHLCNILKLNPATTPRIQFHEITKPAILNAVANPGRLDMNMVNAQQARAMLDMLVGFTISRCLWKKVAPKLSAGRCQTPALRLVVDRDTEIANHTARNYWVLKAKLATSATNTPPLLDIKTDGEWIEAKARETLALAATNKSTETTVLSVKERLATSNAPAPLITSTLQQEASAAHGLNPKATMAAAQKLYEAGHITYMRTDNPQLSVEAAASMRSLISETWGNEFVGPAGQHQVSEQSSQDSDSKPETKSKKGKKKSEKAEKAEAPAVEAQNAHEAIRPTHPEVQSLPEVEHSQQVVYKLIWRRAMQSQMAAARTHVRTAQFKMEALPSLTWSGEQTKPAFDGWRILDKSEKVKESEAADEAAWQSWTPHMNSGSVVHWSTLQADEVFTKPPGRYTEATLIRELEKRGIGRPSTFASLVTTLFDRDYVEKTNKEGQVYETRHLALAAKAKQMKETKETHKAGAEKNKIAATSLGVSVAEYLNQDFSDLFAYDFTAHMEGTLDQIAKGEKAWKEILQETWDTYKERYDAIQAEKGNGKSKALPSEAIDEPGVKLIQTKLGPRLVRPKADGSGDEFAPLPEGITFANAEKKLTEALIEAAFEAAKTAREGEEVGVWLEKPILKKRGPFGFYVEADGIKVPWKPEDTEETLVAKLEAKKGAFERKVGDWTIKQGPYGYYFYKPNPKGKKGPPKFHKFPADADPETVAADVLDSAAAAPKPPTRRPPPKKKE